MSMKELGAFHLPAGTLVSPIRRQIVAHLKAFGPATMQALDQMLEQTVPGYESEQGHTRLHGHLYNLRTAGHVHRVGAAESGMAEWAHGPEPVAPGAAQPRQVTLLNTSVYRPAPGPVPRAGSMDHTRIDSLMGSRRVPFRGAP